VVKRASCAGGRAGEKILFLKPAQREPLVVHAWLEILLGDGVRRALREHGLPLVDEGDHEDAEHREHGREHCERRGVQNDGAEQPGKDDQCRTRRDSLHPRALVDGGDDRDDQREHHHVAQNRGGISRQMDERASVAVDDVDGLAGQAARGRIALDVRVLGELGVRRVDILAERGRQQDDVGHHQRGDGGDVVAAVHSAARAEVRLLMQHG
jgi:hypothetical protein